MYVGVFLHIRFLVKALPAVLAGVWPSVRMDQQVRGQGAGPLETFATLLALHKRINTLNHTFRGNVRPHAHNGFNLSRQRVFHERV